MSFRMKEWKQVSGRVQQMKIVQSKLSGEQKKKKGETFSTAACLNRPRSAEHNPDLKN